MLTEIRHKVNLDLLILWDNGGQCGPLFTFHFSTRVFLGLDTLETEKVPFLREFLYIFL